MRRDDWKYDEEAWDEVIEEKGNAPPPERQCPLCLHWIDREAPCCSWCGKAQEEIRKR